MNIQPKRAGTLRLAVVSAVLAVLFDLLLYDSVFHLLPLGVNAPLYILAFYVAMGAILGRRFTGSLRRFPFHLALVTLLALTFVLYNDVVLLSINGVLLVLLTGEHILLCTHNTVYNPYSVAFIGDSMVFWFGLPFSGMGPAFKSYGTRENASHIKGVIIGLVIAIPTVAAVLALLLSADAAFNKILYDFFGDVKWEDVAGNILVGVALFALFSGLLWYLRHRKRGGGGPAAMPQAGCTGQPSSPPNVSGGGPAAFPQAGYVGQPSSPPNGTGNGSISMSAPVQGGGGPAAFPQAGYAGQPSSPPNGTGNGGANVNAPYRQPQTTAPVQALGGEPQTRLGDQPSSPPNGSGGSGGGPAAFPQAGYAGQPSSPPNGSGGGPADFPQARAGGQPAPETNGMNGAVPPSHHAAPSAGATATAAPAQGPRQASRVTLTAAAFLLLVLDIVLGVFCLAQFAYLFAGRVPEGMNYAQYARTGFWQLLGVAAIVMAVLYLVFKLFREKRAASLKVLLTALCALTIIVLVSAFLRMVLYEQEYLFTVLRILTQFFMVALGVALALCALAAWLPRFPLKKSVFAAGMACYMVLALMNLDGVIARENIRWQKDAGVDLAYLSTLSADALPYYIDLLDPNEFATYTEPWDETRDYTKEDRDVIIDDGVARFAPSREARSIASNLYGLRAGLEEAAGPVRYNANRARALALMDAHPQLMDNIATLVEEDSGRYDGYYEEELYR